MEDDDVENANNTLYHAFKDQHPCWLFVTHAIIKCICVLPGFLFNFSLLYVTARSNILRGTTNFLIALNSGIEIVHQTGHFIAIYTAFSGQNFVVYPTAVRICTPAIMALFAAGPSLLCIGIDRLLAVAFLKFYQQINRGLYLFISTAFCFGYAGYLIALVYRDLDNLENLQVTGNIADLLQGYASQVYYKISLILNLSTLGIYIFVGILIHFRSVEKSNVRIYRSLLAIISVSISGYLLMRIYTSFVIPHVGWGPITVWNIRQYLTILMNISAGSNTPILYMTSVDYRKAFRHELGRIEVFLQKHKLLKKKMSAKVQSVNSINYNGNQNMNNMNILRQSISQISMHHNRHYQQQQQQQQHNEY